MNVITAVRVLGPVDTRGVFRDPMLRWVIVLSPVMALAFRFVVPLIAEMVRERLDFDLLPYYSLIASVVVLITPGLVGTVIGFLLLDQRDDRTLTALLVTPLSLGDYLAYRLSVPIVVSVLLGMIMIPLAGLVETTLAQIVVASISAAPVAALYTLFIGAIAANKVQGFAIAKGIGILFPPVIVAYFVAMPWQPLFGLIPLYWPVKTYWLFADGEPGLACLYAVIGLVYQLLLLGMLVRFFGRTIRRS